MRPAGGVVAERVVVHVGPPKSATTAVQTVLWEHRDDLAGAGVLLPGRGPFEHNLVATALREGPAARRAHAVLTRVARRAARWPGTVVLSCEWFAYGDATLVDRLRDAFPAPVLDVVVTARDLEAVAPAAWQERLKLGHSVPLDDFVDELDLPGRWSWETLDPSLVLERWARPGVRRHVVTVPGSGSPSSTLWGRFARACGIDPALCSPDSAVANESLAVGPARLLELWGPRLRAAVDADTAAWTEQYRWLRRLVSHQLLVPRPGDRIALSAAQSAAVRERSRTTRDRIGASGVVVHGDLADLTPALPRQGVHPDHVDEAALLDAAGDLVAGLLRELRDHSGSIRG